MTTLNALLNSDEFIGRHIGADSAQVDSMLQAIGEKSLDNLIQQTVPSTILKKTDFALNEAVSEANTLARLKAIASKNKLHKNYIGMGYYPTHTPTVIVRNILENPGWYTAYTPYQPEIAQGRLEMLLAFQQMVIDLTGMEMANASLLDEATAAAEAMAMSQRIVKKNKSLSYFVDKHVHPQTLAVVSTRAKHFGFELIIGDAETELANEEFFGVLLQYPNTYGKTTDLTSIIALAHEKNAIVTVASDLLALSLLTPPGEMGADIVVGNSQRFGVPMGFGGPHAAFFACKEEYKRSLPGRIIGVSKDADGNLAYRMALQTREQHIRREKATSNICTSQALLAIMATAFAIYHGPEGIKRIAQRVARLTAILANGLEQAGFVLTNNSVFDTVLITTAEKTESIYQKALQQGINLRYVDNNQLAISLDETTQIADVVELLALFSDKIVDIAALDNGSNRIPSTLQRQSNYLTHAVFNRYHCETEMLRYLKRLENKDVALNHSMIALGSCTMKLNASSEMMPISWPEFANLHPFAPKEQSLGYQEMLQELEAMLKACTGYDAISFQPNAGSQGEYAGLLVIKAYYEAKGDSARRICLIPSSAHGTNPASAAMANLDVVIVKCDNIGNVDMDDLKAKVAQYGEEIAAIMVTYPSTHGVFEESITEICQLIHSVGAQVYVDGANLNALVGVAAPGEFGADVSHLNLHKTFAIPHGGGGPGMGPIGVKAHLAAYLPKHPLERGNEDVVSAAPFGSAGILPISWAYIHMMGKTGMRRATEIAILNANYVAKRLGDYFPVLYTGKNGRVAHECIIDIRPLKEASGISEEDIAKRLMDFGFHAPTMSFPVAGTLMIEPTESESLEEIDRFCDSLIQIHHEVQQVQNGIWPLDDNPLVNAPHTHQMLLNADWAHPYTREQAAYPLAFLRDNKYWPPVRRIDGVYGDRNLFCACPSVDSYN